MICKNCDGNIKENGVECASCHAPIHSDCAFQCIECGVHLCDGCAIKTKYKCLDCYNVQKFDMEFISSTMFESYLKCPHSFKHEHILKTIPEEQRQNKYSALGSVVHALFDTYSKIRPLEDSILQNMIQEYIKAFNDIPVHLFDLDDKEEFFNKGTSIINNWFAREQSQPLPLFTENQQFFVLDERLPKIRVTFDRIDGELDKPDEWRVVDYKSGKVYTSDMLTHNMQLPIYAMAIKKIYGALPKSLNLIFPQHLDKKGNMATRVFERMSDDVYVCDVTRGGTYTISLSERLEQMVDIYDHIKRGDFAFNTKNTHYCQNFCRLGVNGMCDGLATQWKSLTNKYSA